MKATGIVRNMDNLGRLVIPSEIRRVLQIEEKDPVEIFVDEDMIILKKYHPSCVFCSNDQGVIAFKGRNICPACLQELTK